MNNTATYMNTDGNTNMMPFSQPSAGLERHNIDDVMNAIYGLTQVMVPQINAFNEVRQDVSAMQNDMSAIQGDMNNVKQDMKTYAKEVAEVKESFENQRMSEHQEGEMTKAVAQAMTRVGKEIARIKGWDLPLTYAVYTRYINKCFWREVKAAYDLPRKWKGMSLRQFSQTIEAVKDWEPMGNIYEFIRKTDEKIDAKRRAKEITG